jgi:HAD superfamily hydrolase (TIGR01509 family)
MLECIVFDLDGLLVDSEPLQFRSYRQAFAAHGVEIDRADWHRWHSVEASVPAWIALDRLPVDAETVRAEKKTIYERMVSEELTLKTGAEALVRGLSANYRLCVASGSRVESIQLCLDKFSLGECFEAFYSGTALPRSKPHPDIYLHALSSMGVEAKNTLAIEDSVQGLKAAMAAGIKCVVCPDTSGPTPRPEYVGAAKLVRSLSDLDADLLVRLVA